MKKMRILIIADEVWNDSLYGNNVLSNWFDGFDADFAEIYCEPGSPLNNCCENYYQLTDASMAKSIIGKRAGCRFTISKEMMHYGNGLSIVEQKPERFYKFMKSIAGNGLRVLRDCIWLLGHYDKKELYNFINDFNPDIVFCPRLLTPKLRRLENVVSKMTTAPFVAFTADDEASLKEVNYSLIYWLRRLAFRRVFKKHIPLYRYYFTFSEDQAKEYAEEYGVETSTLFKCGNFVGTQIVKQPNNPLKFVYAGQLYCNRWKTLAEIGKALKIINRNNIKAELYIYTKDTLSKKQSQALSDENYIHVMGAVKPQDLMNIYKSADIALHVESFDKKYKYATRVSFSTKIIDLMASSCAIMAICWDKHAGYQYLNKNDAALCISSYNAILPAIQDIVDYPNKIQLYANKAWKCGQKNHSRGKIQNQIRTKFLEINNEII